MQMPSILVASWNDGLFLVHDGSVRQEIAGQPVRGLVADGRGGVLAIVGGHSLCRRSPEGGWTELARSEADLSCCISIEDAVFVGTDDASIMRIDRDGFLHRLTGFDAVPGRESWYAGAAMVDGKLIGPPLGIRSMAASCDGAVLLANVHVGGVPRSTDLGLSWEPTIAVDEDVHQVCAHPSRPELAIAAAAEGLCVSRDAGATWAIERGGLPSSYCAAVAFGRNDLFVSNSTDHFAGRGAVYRRPIDAHGPLQPLGGGIPEWLEGIVDTGCIATRGASVAVIDRSGTLYVSSDDGDSWSAPVRGPAAASGLHIL